MSDKERYKREHLHCHTIADLKYHLICFGDHLAEREGYKEHKGIDALHYYLVQKHNWLPQVVRSMNDDDLRFLLDEDISGWTLPEEAHY
jgi:hypothetical protein